MPENKSVSRDELLDCIAAAWVERADGIGMPKGKRRDDALMHFLVGANAVLQLLDPGDGIGGLIFMVALQGERALSGIKRND